MPTQCCGSTVGLYHTVARGVKDLFPFSPCTKCRCYNNFKAIFSIPQPCRYCVRPLEVLIWILHCNFVLVHEYFSRFISFESKYNFPVHTSKTINFQVPDNHHLLYTIPPSLAIYPNFLQFPFPFPSEQRLLKCISFSYSKAGS